MLTRIHTLSGVFVLLGIAACGGEFSSTTNGGIGSGGSSDSGGSSSGGASAGGAGTGTGGTIGSSGGSDGAGGVHSNGGTGGEASGGADGSGGAQNTGGVNATGGVQSTGGANASGGVQNAGGSGSSCLSQNDEPLPDLASMDCNQLGSVYAEALAQAKVCGCDADCSVTACDDFCCNCSSFVNPKSSRYGWLDAIQTEASKRLCITICPLFLCPLPTGAACATSSGATGMCQDH